MTPRRPGRTAGYGAPALVGVLVSLLVGCTAATSGGGPAAASAVVPVSTGGTLAGSPATPITPPSTGRDVTLPDAGLPTLQPDSVRQRVPTRVVVRELRIDLPIVAPAGHESGRFPWCNVAEFLPSMSRPGRPGTTFIYAHAREGMFLPILEASRVQDGSALLGARIEVFSSDDRRFSYEVVQVLRHVVSLDFAYRATAEQLILQTSEGAGGTPGKTMLLARPIEEAPASAADARPAARPVRCG